MIKRTCPFVWLVFWLLTSSAFSEAPESAPEPPFRLTPAETKHVGRVLERWEQWNSQVKTFRCRFKRWTYDLAIGPSNRPKYIDLGAIEYAAPDRITYRVDSTENDGKIMPIKDERAEHWVFDGSSILEFQYKAKRLIERKLPPDVQKSRLVDGPLSFGFVWASIQHCWYNRQLQTPYPFGAKAEDLKQQYFIREITPKENDGKIWLGAYPRERRTLFNKMQLIFSACDISPFALRIVHLNGKDYTVYQFYDIVVNDPLSSTDADPFRPAVPPGWQRVVE